MGSVPVREGWLISVGDGATTLSPDRSEVVAYDLEGRPQTWFVRGETYKRSLASHVYGRRTTAGVRRRWRVPDAEALPLFERALRVAVAAAAATASVAPPRGAEERLERILSWTPERLAAEGERFALAYTPVSILPPDQYGAIVLQASFGCSWNRCTYCTFYQDRPFSMRDPEVFGLHVEAVRALLGDAAAARRGLFLADGNALVLSNARLEPLVTRAREAFPDRPIAGFVDVFSGERKPASDWRALRELGLERVAIGVETGHDPLLAYLDKPGGADAATEFVTLLKRAGLAVSVILMVGAGGRRYAEGHLRDSAALLARLPLDQADLVYLSPFVVQPGSAYAERAERDGIIALGEEERQVQERLLRAAARAAAPTARVARYHIDEFVY
jgi:radical SAM superfamily enzyme YgiQ (UPF0313 family)